MRCAVDFYSPVTGGLQTLQCDGDGWTKKAAKQAAAAAVLDELCAIVAEEPSPNYMPLVLASTLTLMGSERISAAPETSPALDPTKPQMGEDAVRKP
jgi:hypothetical protein